MSTSGKRPMLIAAAGLVMMLAPTPPPLRGQDSTMDAWRGSISEHLDQAIAGLRHDVQQPRTSPVLVMRAGKPEEASQSPVLSWPKGSVPPEPFPTLANILREKGLPASLMGLAAVESSFNPLALSPKGARGLWQLMPETARRYGLVVEPLRDDRTDPVKSTQAAAHYLKDLFAQFRDWPLVFAAYNAGARRVAQVIDREGARDFWTLARHTALPDETMRYVPAVLEKVATDFADHSLGYSSKVGRDQTDLGSGSPRSLVVYATPARLGI